LLILATVNYNAIKLSSQSASSVEDALAVEHPLSVAVNGEAFTLTMQTPGDEADLVRGLLFTEGIIKKWKGELDFEVTEVSEAGFVSKVNIVIPEKSNRQISIKQT
jgi:FdhD protein